MFPMKRVQNTLSHDERNFRLLNERFESGTLARCSERSRATLVLRLLLLDSPKAAIFWHLWWPQLLSVSLLGEAM